MSDNERPTGLAIINAIRAQRELRGTSDRTNLNDTLVKSARWKENTLGALASGPSGDNDDAANLEERRLSTTLRRSSEEIERLKKIIAKLKAENDRLAVQRQEELGAHETELSEFQAAYDQFQQQSDILINELDQENERLRLACKLNNRQSIL